VVTFPTSSLFKISVAPELVPIDSLYPVASAIVFQLKSVVISTSVALFNGLESVVQPGIVGKVSVVKNSSLQFSASPTAL